MKETLKAAFTIGLMTAVGGMWATTKLFDKIDEKLKEKARFMEATKDEQ